MKFKKHTIIIFALISVVLVTTSIYFFSREDDSIDVSQKVSVSFSTQFSNQYIENNRGKIMVEIPEVYELLNIVIALSNIDKDYSSLTNKQTRYYQSVIEHFGEYRNHPIVDEIESANKNMGYSNVRNLFIYSFSDDSIVHGGIYTNNYIQERTDKYIEQLQDFAKVSGFRQFYDEHKDYYREQISIFKDIVPVRNMWRWLEMNFPIQHDTYKIIMSPLTGGSHNTFNYRDKNNNYSEIVMFISAPNIIDFSQNSQRVVEGLISRMLFTEIDHNYVNPITDLDKNIMDVVEAFSNLEKWNKASSYGRPALTFNEYMTWGVFMLYAHDIYNGKDLAEIEKVTVDIMNYRGFVHFQQFYNELLDLYEVKEDSKTVADLFPNIIEWCKKYK